MADGICVDVLGRYMAARPSNLPRPSTAFYGLPLAFHGLPWPSAAFHWPSMAFHGLPWPSTGLPWPSTGLYRPSTASHRPCTPSHHTLHALAPLGTQRHAPPSLSPTRTGVVRQSSSSSETRHRAPPPPPPPPPQPQPPPPRRCEPRSSERLSRAVHCSGPRCDLPSTSHHLPSTSHHLPFTSHHLPPI